MSGLLLAAKAALEFIQSIDGYENSVTAVNLRREIEAVERELYFDKSDQLLKAMTAAIELQQENERLQKMIDNSSAIVADCAMLVGAMRELCYEIEKCGASEQLTNTVVLASEITNELKYITGGVAVEHRVHPTSEILRRLREVSTTKPDTDLKPGSSPLTCG